MSEKVSWYAMRTAAESASLLQDIITQFDQIMFHHDKERGDGEIAVFRLKAKCRKLIQSLNSLEYAFRSTED